MAIDPASFKIRFPEFDSVSDARIQLFIDDAVIVLNSVYWGDKYDLGLNYLTAHLLTLGTKSEAGSSTSVGGIASRAVDGAQVSYNVTPTENQADAELASTIYGQRYLALRKTLGVAASVI
jgi:hypothetical protein